VEDCTFINNRHTYANSDAPGGGGVDTYPGAGEVRNCLIVSNAAVNGGGICINSVLGAAYTNYVSSCTIAKNYASGNGGGIYLASGYIGNFEVWNTIIYIRPWHLISKQHGRISKP
jgi:parallel beta-helix repeat protein